MSGRFEAVVGLLERCHDRPLATTAGVAAAVVLSLFFIANLELVTSYAAMLPDDAPEMRDATLGDQEVESTQELTVAVDLEWPTDFFEKNWLLLLDRQPQREVIDEIVDQTLAIVAPDFDIEYRLSGHMVLAVEEYESLLAHGGPGGGAGAAHDGALIAQSTALPPRGDVDYGGHGRHGRRPGLDEPAAEPL